MRRYMANVSTALLIVAIDVRVRRDPRRKNAMTEALAAVH